MLAIALSNPDIALEEDEAKRLAKSYVKMQAHYGMNASAKLTDTIAFVMCAVSIEGPRLLPIIRKVTEKPKKKANVVPLREAAE